MDVGRRANVLPPATSSNHSDIDVNVEIERIRLFRYGTDTCAMKAHNMTRGLRSESLDRLMRERNHALPGCPSTDAREPRDTARRQRTRDRHHVDRETAGVGPARGDGCTRDRGEQKAHGG